MHAELIAFIGILSLVSVSAWLGYRDGAAPDRHVRALHDFHRTRYFSGLDALRAVSVIAVVWSHVSGSHDLTILNAGNKGVDLFFAISGFLVTTLLLREYSRNGTISLRDFYIRRSLRIFPLYYTVLGLYCVLVFATMQGTPKAAEFWDNLPAFLTYTSNWFVTLDGAAQHGVTFYFAWSLATEEQFYLFWPALVVLAFWLTGRTWAPAVAAALLICIQILAAGQVRPNFLMVVLASLAPAILFGAMFAVLLNDRRIFQSLFPILGHPAAAPLVLAALLAALQFEATLVVTRFLMALLVACLCVREDTVLHPVLRWKPLVTIGTISYGIYLMHMLAANVIRKLTGEHSGLLVFFLSTALVVAMAYVSYRYFESPILRLKGRFQGKPTTSAPQPAPASQL